MSRILPLIENTVDLDITEKYAAILGESPSKGAKSPSLWNAAFNDLKIPAIMHSMDIRPENLEAVVNALRDDERFIGAAITMPYKIDILPFLDKLEPEAATIGAVNCIYRNGTLLVGTNTDGAGAISSLQQGMSTPISGATALLIGTGGAGYAVATYVATALGVNGSLLVANRDSTKSAKLANRLEPLCRSEAVQWPITPAIAERCDIIINCSSVGFETLKTDSEGAYSLKYCTPLYHTPKTRVTPGVDAEHRYVAQTATETALNIASSMVALAGAKSPYVFDIIYQPEQSLLLAISTLMGYETLSGKGMNLEQAVIAFDKACSASKLYTSDMDLVRKSMSHVW